MCDNLKEFRSVISAIKTEPIHLEVMSKSFPSNFGDQGLENGMTFLHNS